MKNLGIILLNMGGPTSLDSVRPFLENLFLDKEIISFGPMNVFRGPLARFIAKKRAEIVKKNYAMIGGKSPIAALSAAQASALETRLTAHWGGEVRVRVVTGFSYWHPFIHEAMRDLDADGFSEIFLLPLYPQYSKTTTGSCFKTWRDLHRTRPGARLRVQSIKAYPVDPQYLDALNERISEALLRFPENRRSAVTLLFSAHGTPVTLVSQGDPYSHQIRATVDAVMARRSGDLRHELSFQSKVGPTRWLEPNTVDMVKSLASQGVRDLLVVPIAFVSDHIETLHELDIEVREVALHAGITQFEVTTGLNDSPTYIASLAHLVTTRMERVWNRRSA